MYRLSCWMPLCTYPPQYMGQSRQKRNTAKSLKTHTTCLTQHSLAHDSPCLKTMQVNKCRCFACLFCFCPRAFFPFLFTCSHFHLLHAIPRARLSLPPLWFCRSSHDQARYPGNYPALSNKETTDSNEEWNIKDRRCLCSHYLSTQETERRSESSGTCSEATTTLSLPFLDTYHQWKQKRQTCPGSQVTAHLFVLHTCLLLARRILYSGHSATLTRGILLYSSTFLLVSPDVRSWKSDRVMQSFQTSVTALIL